MAIQIKFDKSYNPIQPTLVLATRSGRKLGAIPATNIRFQDNMNAASEMSFSVYRDRGDNSAAIWDAITDLRLVWCKEWDAWFEIEVEISETDALMKTVSGTSLAEAELSQINLYEIEINTEEDVENYTKLHPDDDYSPTVLYDPEHPSQSLLHRLLQKAPHYSIGHVDTELADKQRTFSFDNKSIYDAFQEVAEELECLFVLDNSTRNADGTVEEIMSAFSTQAIFGNVDMNNRPVIRWTQELVDRWEDALESYDIDTSELIGSISTVLGTAFTYDNLDIAFTPIVKTDSGDVYILSSDEADEYICALFDELAESHPNGWSTEDFLRLDANNDITINGVHVQRIIADVGENAISTSEHMHDFGVGGTIEEWAESLSLGDLQRVAMYVRKYGVSTFDDLRDALENGEMDGSEFGGGIIGMPSRTVSVYSVDNYGESTNIFVSTENLTDEVRLTTDVGEIKNCFKLQAGDDVMSAALRACNPNGSDYIWFFSDDMKTDMSHELASALDDYETDYDIINGIDFNSKHIVKASGGYSISSGCILTNGEKDLLLPDPQTDPPTVIDMDGYAGLVNTQYRAMERIDELTHTMSPGIDTTKPTIDHEKAAVDAAFANNSGFVAVSDVSRASEATVKSALKSRARAIVDSRFKVDVSSVSQPEEGATAWSGVVRISEYGDESIYRDSSVSFAVTDDLEKYIEQNIDIVLNKRESVKDAYDIPAIAKMPYSSDQEKAAFAEKVAMYSLKRLESLYDALRACMDIMIEQDVASGTWNEDIKSDLYDPYREKLGYTEREIAIRQQSITSVEQVLAKLTNQIATINDILNLENYLGSGAYLELSAYRRDDTYQNDNYISDGLTDAEIIENARQFYEAAIKECGKAAYGTHTISAKLANLLVIKEFEPIADAFEVGNYIRIEIDGRIFKLRMLQYEIDYENIGDLTVEFSDYNALRDGATEIASILKNASSMSSSFSYVARQADKGKKANEQLTETTQNGLDLTKTRIVDNPDNQCITMDENGMLCRRKDPATGEYDPRQLKIINNGMYITADNWDTVSAAFGNILYYHPTQKVKESYGAIAQAFIGDEFVLGDMFSYHGALFYIKSEMGGKRFRVLCLNGCGVPEAHRNVYSTLGSTGDSIYGVMRSRLDSLSDLDNISTIISQGYITALVSPAFYTDFYSLWVTRTDEGVYDQFNYAAIRDGIFYSNCGMEVMDITSFVGHIISVDNKVLLADSDDISGNTIGEFGAFLLPSQVEGTDYVAGTLDSCIIWLNGDGTVTGQIVLDSFEVSDDLDAVGKIVEVLELNETQREYIGGATDIVLENGDTIRCIFGMEDNKLQTIFRPSASVLGYSGGAVINLRLESQSRQ